MVGILTEEQVICSFARHDRSDWGDVSPHQKKQNKHNLTNGGEIISHYHTQCGKAYFVRTTADSRYTFFERDEISDKKKKKNCRKSKNPPDAYPGVSLFPMRWL